MPLTALPAALYFTCAPIVHCLALPYSQLHIQVPPYVLVEHFAAPISLYVMVYMSKTDEVDPFELMVGPNYDQSELVAHPNSDLMTSHWQFRSGSLNHEGTCDRLLFNLPEMG